MTEFDKRGKSEYSLNFDENHIYETTYRGRNVTFFECSDEEVKTLMENRKKVTLCPIEDGDVIFFAQGSTFPKLLLSRLGLTVKRTLKTDKATKIILDEKRIINENSSNMTMGYIIIPNKGSSFYYIEDSNLEEREIPLELAKTYFPGEWKRVICLLNECANQESIDLLNDHAAIITTPIQLTEYLNSKLTKLDAETKDTMMSMLKSVDEEHNKLAVSMLGMYDLSDVLYDVYYTLGSSRYIPDTIKNSVIFKYLLSLIECTPSELIEAFESYYWRGSCKQRVLAKIFNLPLNHDQKLKCFKRFKETCGFNFLRLSADEKKQLDELKMPYIYA